MCCCGKPTINGTPGYSWDGHTYSTRPVDPPALQEGDDLLFDEPGRCGGLDAHSHHFRLVKRPYSNVLLVRHGGGDECIQLGASSRLCLDAMATLDSNGRYWLLHLLYSTSRDASGSAREEANASWRKAVVEKRIRTRKLRGQGRVKVWIEPAAQKETHAHA